MTEALDYLANFIVWLLLTSLKATIIIALILLMQIVFRKFLTAKWQHVLWFLLIIRLISPVDIPSQLSIFNLTNDIQYNNTPLFEEKNKLPPFELNPQSIKVNPTEMGITEIEPETMVRVIPSRYQILFTPINIIGFIWFIIALFLFTYLIVMNLRLSRRISHGSVISHSKILDILERCKKQVKVNRSIKVIALEDTNIPFSFGWIKSRIILPTELVDQQDPEKLEHIFMHELVHYKQWDVSLALLATILQILHWFNPAIWFAFFKMRTDREMACDELVLTKIGKDKNKQYGRTLISLIESASQRGVLPIAVGLADTKFYLKRRINMIANFSPKSLRWTVFALLLLSTISIFVLTNAVTKGNIVGKVIYEGNIIPDSVYVKIYHATDYSSSYLNNWEKPLATFASDEKEFSFTMNPGVYKATAHSEGFKEASVQFIVPTKQTKTSFLFTLPPANESKVSTVEINGREKQKSYNEAYKALKEFRAYEREELGHVQDWAEQKELTQKILQEMNIRHAKIEPEFKILFDLYYLHHCYRMLPPTYDLLEMLPKQVPTKEELRDFVRSDNFLPYIQDLKIRLNRLDPKSPLLTGEFLNGFNYLNEVLTLYPEIEQDIGFNTEYLFSFLVNFIRQIPYEQQQTKLILETACNYTQFWSDVIYDEEKACYLIDWLELSYPVYYSSKKEDINFLYKLMEFTAFTNARDFSVKTLNGSSFSLSEQEGLWTILVFWDPDHFSQDQIRHLDELGEYHKKRSKILGLVRESSGYSKEELLAFVKQHNIPFENAMVSEEIISSYNVPNEITTSFIVKDMRLIFENLKGELTFDELKAVIDIGGAKYRGKMYR